MSSYVVSRQDLAYNVQHLKELAKNVPIWAVVKADGYGLGTASFARELYELGLDRFCVTELREAQAIRDSGLTEVPILMLRQVNDSEQIRCLEKLSVIFTVGSLEAARSIDSAVTGPVKVHLKIDTGMGRYGFFPHQTEKMLSVFRDTKHLQVTGVFTHFNCAYFNEALTKQEYAMFQGAVEALRKAGVEPGCVHCCNSAAFLKHSEMHGDGVRLGSALLGRMSFPTKLRPLGEVETQIEEIRTLPAGHSTGYGAIWKAKKESRIAILPVGWYHGLQVSAKPDRSRAGDCIRGMLGELRNLLKRPKLTVQISGKACPIVGALGSLHCAVDVTNVPCEIGQTVKLQISPMHIKGMEVEFR